MSNNCVNYGSKSGAFNKALVKLGKPEEALSDYDFSKRLIKPDCITCHVTNFLTAPSQCSVCSIRPIHKNNRI